MDTVIDYINTLISGDRTEAIITVTLYIIILSIVFDALRMLKTLIINAFLAHQSTPFSSTHTSEGKKKILIIGDSTAVGTGAAKPEDSIAGRLGRDFQNSEIINLGTDGSRTRDVMVQLKKVADQKFDMVIISTGGNDIWHFSNIKKLGRNLEEALDLAKEISNHKVILLLYNNIGSAPIFSFLIRGLLKRRARKVQEKFQNVAELKKVPCIELFAQEENNPFLQNPDLLYAADKIHPSSEGYKMWYNRMWLSMVQRGYLFSDK